MYILGLSCFYHDSAAALIKDGVIVAAAQEERFTRIRHDSAFPTQAIAFCLAEAGITAASISRTATTARMTPPGENGDASIGARVHRAKEKRRGSLRAVLFFLLNSINAWRTGSCGEPSAGHTSCVPPRAGRG